MPATRQTCLLRALPMAVTAALLVTPLGAAAQPSQPKLPPPPPPPSSPPAAEDSPPAASAAPATEEDPAASPPAESAPAEGAPAGAESSAPEPAAKPAPTPEAVPAPEPAPPPEAAEAPPTVPLACVPSCRAGFLCLDGVCVSACNPPCGPGERCSDGGECVARGAEDEASGPADRGAEAYQRNARMHDGFFLRGGLGLGAGLFSENHSLGETVIERFSFQLSVDIGGALAENFNLHARLALGALAIVEPDDPSPNHVTYGEVQVSGLLLGPGVTYYFMPLNLYVTGAAGMGVISVGDASQSDDDDEVYGGTGFGASLDVGLEGWVAAQAGIGGALRLQYLTVDHQAQEPFQEDSDLTLLFIGAVGTVTYQ